MNWLPYAFATAVALGLADVFVKIASGKLPNSLAMLLFGSCTFLVGFGWTFLQWRQGVDLSAQPAGIFAGIGVGLAFSMVTLGLYITFGAGAPISLGSPVIRLTGLLLASLFGLAVWREPVSWRYLFGMGLAIAGIYLIITK